MSRDYLGQGLTFPIELKDGAATYTNDKELVEQSIIMILNTPQGTEFFLPEFGSRLHELIFEPNDDVLEDLLRLFVFEAMRDWEKRAEFDRIEFEYDDSIPELVNCRVYYRILQSNEVDSFIYPFYRKLKY